MSFFSTTGTLRLTDILKFASDPDTVYSPTPSTPQVPPSSSPSTPQVPPSSSPPTRSGSEISLSVIDPQLLNNFPRASEPPGTPIRAQTPSPGHTGQAALDDKNEKASQPKRSQKKRVRITQINAVHGYVEGACRGGEEFKVLRLNELKKPIIQSTDSAARFLRLVTDMVIRCEQISSETGCWLFFTAQHLTARAPFIHYSSPRILREGEEDIESIINQFNEIFAKLTAARRHDAREMHVKLVEAQKEGVETRRQLEEVAAQAESSRQALERQERQLEEQTALLEEYRRKLTK
ncbi:hypothetical protein BD779DRAFT_1445562 [Infundibulicybe gibba]|nr:hypothetical protein BD779DRAFT_1445562 [Infundibulicybe gibba]